MRTSVPIFTDTDLRGGGSLPASRRDQILEVATQLMNTKGLAATDLRSIAGHLGIRYNSLYHYFSGKDHLYASAFERTIDLRIRSFEACEHTNPLQWLLAYAARELAAPDGSRAHYAGAAVLSPALRDRFRDRVHAHWDRMAVVVRRGIEAGVISPCDALTRAISVDCVLDRFVITDAIMRHRHLSRPSVAGTVLDILEHGLLSRGQSVPNGLPAGQDISGMVGPAVDAQHTEHGSLERLLSTATDAFNSDAWGASIPDMAARLGTSKTAFYQIAVDKEDLLFQCYLRGVALIEASQRSSSLLADSAAQAIVYHYDCLIRAHGTDAGPFPTYNVQDHLKAPHARVIRIRSQAVRYRSKRRLERAIAAGRLREVDTYVAQPVLGRMHYMLAWWYRDDFHLSLAEVAQEWIGLVFTGLRERP